MSIDSSGCVRGYAYFKRLCNFLGNDIKTFVIYVDPAIGNAINMTINQVKKENTLTHDLIGLIWGLEASMRGC